MDNWGKFKETTLLENEFYIGLKVEEIMNVDQMRRVWKNFQIKNLGEFHDLCLKSDTLLLADVFENFKNMCIKIDKLYPAKSLPVPGLAWQAA